MLVFLQVWLFNKIHIEGVATPLLYVYFIVKLPVDANRNLTLVLSALLGLTIDMFSFTLGMNMLASVVIGFLRSYFLKLFAPRDIFESYMPSFSAFGKAMFMRYASLMILMHQFVLFMVESLSFFDALHLFLRIAGSFTITALLVFAFESIKFEKFKT
jgi:rod shape-determining protein MreD